MSHRRAVLDAACENLQFWTINCDVLILNLVCHFFAVSPAWSNNFSNEEKWSLLIKDYIITKTKQNSTVAQLC